MPIWRGEVYFVDLGRTIGREQQGVRPVVVMSNDLLNRQPLVVAVVPGTSGKNVRQDFPSNVRVPAGEANLPDETVFLTFQVRALDHRRFVNPPFGQVSPNTLAELEQALVHTFALPGGTAPGSTP